MTTLTRGDKLPADLRAQVLNSYIYRLTTENGYPARNPCHARVPAITDAEWLAEHAFYVTKRGTLDARRNSAEPAYLIEGERYQARVAALESEGMTTSDAQAVADVEPEPGAVPTVPERLTTAQRQYLDDLLDYYADRVREEQDTRSSAVHYAAIYNAMEVAKENIGYWIADGMQTTTEPGA